jgi:hypothetical protein
MIGSEPNRTGACMSLAQLCPLKKTIVLTACRARTYKRRMVSVGTFRALPLVTLGLGLLVAPASFADEPALNKPPTRADWLKLSTLPDWSGVWNPNISDQNAQIKTNPVPWKPEVQARIDHLAAEEKAGRPTCARSMTRTRTPAALV